MTYTTPDTVDGTDRWTESRWDTQVRANFIDHETRISAYESDTARVSCGFTLSGSISTAYGDTGPKNLTLDPSDGDWDWGSWTVSGTRANISSLTTSGTNLYSCQGFIVAVDTNTELSSLYNIHVPNSLGTHFIHGYHVSGKPVEDYSQMGGSAEELFTDGGLYTSWQTTAGRGVSPFSFFFRAAATEDIIFQGVQPWLSMTGGDRVAIVDDSKILLTLVRNYA